MGEKGRVIGIDHIKGLVDESLANVKKDKVALSLLHSKRIQLLGKELQTVNVKDKKIHKYHCDPVGDGRKGYPEEGPFDAIHVGAAAPTLPYEVGKISKQIKYKRLIVIKTFSNLTVDGSTETRRSVSRSGGS